MAASDKLHLGPNEKVIDRNRVIVEEESVEACLRRAAQLLAITREKLDFVILEQGVKGLLGTVNIPFRLRVYRKDCGDADAAESGLPLAGAAASPAAAGQRRVTDAKVKVELSRNRMTASIVVLSPRNGEHVTAQQIRTALSERGVVFGLLEEKIKRIAARRQYDEPYIVAEGLPVEPGQDAKIDFKVRVERKPSPKADEHGNVDFHEIDMIENVTEGQLLAVKIPAVEGTAGQNVCGDPIMPKDVKDVNLVAGKNVCAGDAGMEFHATIDGQIVSVPPVLSVEPIYEINGNVDYHTGNITFLGTVVVRGSVEDNFTVRAANDIEVYGSVGMAFLDAEGSIQVRGGIRGKEEGIVKARRDVVAKFIENANVHAGNNVVASEAIMHSNVDAGNCIALTGKKALMVGGHYRAGNRIYARVIGTELGTRTMLEVGIQLQLRDNLRDAEQELNKYKMSLHKVMLGLKALLKIKQMGKPMTVQKEQMFQELKTLGERLKEKVTVLTDRIESVKDQLAHSNNQGKVGVEGRIHPGSSVTIGNAALQIAQPADYVIFYYERGEVRSESYMKPNMKKLLESNPGEMETEHGDPSSTHPAPADAAGAN